MRLLLIGALLAGGALILILAPSPDVAAAGKRSRNARRTGREATSVRATSGYASEDFKSLCAAVRELEALRRSGQWSRLLLAARRRRRAIWRGLGAVRRLRRLDLPLTAAPPGRAIRHSVERRAARVARAVLLLPHDQAQYHRGRSRQALRTNVGHAEALGITCHELPAAAQQSAALDELVRNLGCTNSDRSYLELAIGLEPGRQDFHAAVDASGHVIALAVLDVDVRCARLVFLHSVGDRPGGLARYALSRHVIDALIDRRVSFCWSAVPYGWRPASSTSSSDSASRSSMYAPFP